MKNKGLNNNFKLNNLDFNIFKKEFLRNGWVYTFWGIVGTIIPALILGLQNSPYQGYAGLPYWGYPIASIISTSLVIKNQFKEKSNNHLSKTISILWAVASVNIIVVALIFVKNFSVVLFPMILMFLSIAQTTTGVLLRHLTLFITGLFLMPLAWMTLYFQWDQKEQLFVLLIAAIIGQLIPGIVLQWFSHKTIEKY